jgi:hypothetical protein
VDLHTTTAVVESWFVPLSITTTIFILLHTTTLEVEEWIRLQ